MTHKAALALVMIGAALNACSGQDKRNGEKAPESSTPSAKRLDLEAPETLGNGLWRVTLINGQALPQGAPPILVSVDGESMRAESQCVWWQWSHAVAGPAFAAAPLPRLAVHEQDGAVPVPMCARGLTAQEADFAKAIENGNELIRTSPKALQIKGLSGSITLEKQEGAAPPITLIQRDSLAGAWRVSAVDGSPPELVDGPFRIRFGDRNAMSSSSCLAWFWIYQGAKGQIAFSKRPLLIPICERGLGLSERIFADRIEAIRTLVRKADGTVLLEGDKGSLTLVPEG